jgi:hypothetical protein
MFLYRWAFHFGLVQGNGLESCFDEIGNFNRRGAVEMTEHSNRIPTAKSWADDIDDLYHDAMEKSLRATLWTRTRKPVADAEGAEDQSLGAGPAQLEVTAGGNLQ